MGTTTTITVIVINLRRWFVAEIVVFCCNNKHSRYMWHHPKETVYHNDSYKYSGKKKLGKCRTLRQTTVNFL